MVSPSSENGHCCACGFHLLYMEMLLFFPLRLLSLAPGKKKNVVKIDSLVSLFGQLIVGSIEKCFVLFFVFYAHSHCSVSPQV